MAFKRTIMLLAGAVGVVLVAAAVLWVRRDMPTSVPAEPPTKINIQVFGRFPDSDEDYKVSITNRVDCYEVNKALMFGRKQRPHPCASLGKMTLHYANGASNVISLGAGHSEDRYEFGFNGLYSIPRGTLSKAVARAGVDNSKLQLGNHP